MLGHGKKPPTKGKNRLYFFFIFSIIMLGLDYFYYFNHDISVK